MTMTNVTAWALGTPIIFVAEEIALCRESGQLRPRRFVFPCSSTLLRVRPDVRPAPPRALLGARKLGQSFFLRPPRQVTPRESLGICVFRRANGVEAKSPLFYYGYCSSGNYAASLAGLIWLWGRPTEIFSQINRSDSQQGKFRRRNHADRFRPIGGISRAGRMRKKSGSEGTSTRGA